jgi:hypothetical protein
MFPDGWPLLADIFHPLPKAARIWGTLDGLEPGADCGGDVTEERAELVPSRVTASSTTGASGRQRAYSARSCPFSLFWTIARSSKNRTWFASFRNNLVVLITIYHYKQAALSLHRTL